jgi:hypothetical protein
MQTNPQVNINQFQQSAIVGLLDLGIGSANNLISGIVGASQSLIAGQSVKQSAGSNPGMPVFVAAAVGDVALGRIVHSVKQDTFVDGDAVDIALNNSVIWVLADSSITAGQFVDDIVSDGSASAVEPHGTTGGSKQRGYALDGGAAGQLIRIYVTNPVDGN